MLSKQIIIILFVAFWVQPGMAQFCPPIGQTPDGAYPVCGYITVTEPGRLDCANGSIPAPCAGGMLGDPNPFWYKFTCYKTGNLGFTITPYMPEDDYDWILFDITGYFPKAVYSLNLAIKGNWSGAPGPTGAMNGGSSGWECASPASQNRPTFCSMPPLVVGRKYLLLVSHHTYPPPFAASGFTLKFEGGNADIGDPTLPHLTSASTPCGGTPLTVRFSKKLKCSTVLLDGSQFTISPPLANVVGTGRMGCDNTYELDSAILQLDNTLPAGNYTLSVKPGTLGKEIADFCDNTISASETIPFVVTNPPLPLLQSIVAPGCNPDELQIVFSQKINCASVAANGSDFVVTGSSPVTVIGASGVNCIRDPFYNAYSTTVNIKLSAPISRKGNYQVKLVKGTDGNTVQDQCKVDVLAGATLAFSTKDTVNADFNYNVHLGCKTDTINYFHPGGNDVNEWIWDFDGHSSSLQAPQISYTEFGVKYAQLIVSNGACRDTSALVPILLDNELKAGFEATNTICPGDPASFKDTSKGHIISWLWNFGSGLTSSSPTPVPQFYFTEPFTYTVIPQLTVTNSMGCTSTATQKINVLNRCLILVPGAFTPNNDGLNDCLYPLNGYRSSSLWFIVYNRYGQVMFETRDPAKRWDGKFKGQTADPGTYIWILHYTDKFTNEYVEQKGTSILIR